MPLHRGISWLAQKLTGQQQNMTVRTAGLRYVQNTKRECHPPNRGRQSRMTEEITKKNCEFYWRTVCITSTSCDDVQVSEGTRHWLFSRCAPTASCAVARGEFPALATTLISIQDVYTKLYKSLHHIYYIFPEQKTK